MNFKMSNIICLTLKMSNTHIEVICKKYNIDPNIILELKNKNIKYVYIDVKNFYIVAHLLFNERFTIYEPYGEINTTTLLTIQPLETPKLPKEKEIEQTENITTKFTEIGWESLVNQKLELDLKIKKKIDEMEKQMEQFVNGEEYEKAAKLRDSIKKLKDE